MLSCLCLVCMSVVMDTLKSDAFSVTTNKLDWNQCQLYLKVSKCSENTDNWYSDEFKSLYSYSRTAIKWCEYLGPKSKTFFVSVWTLPTSLYISCYFRQPSWKLSTVPSEKLSKLFIARKHRVILWEYIRLTFQFSTISLCLVAHELISPALVQVYFGFLGLHRGKGLLFVLQVSFGNSVTFK